MALFEFQLSESALKGLGEYIVSGGFVSAGSYWNHSFSRARFQAVPVSLRKALEPQAVREARLQVLPGPYPLHHYYFDSEGRPGGDALAAMRYGAGTAQYLQGIEAGGRLSVVLSKKAYCEPWLLFGTDRRSLQ